MALIWAGVGSAEARFSLKKLDSKKTVIWLEVDGSSRLTLGFEVSMVDMGVGQRKSDSDQATLEGAWGESVQARVT